MIYHVYSNKNNIGDWLSAKSIQSLVGSADVTELGCYSDPRIPDVFNKINNNDFVIIGGGGLFHSCFQNFWNAFLPFSEKINFCIWGVGYCHTKYGNSLCSPKILTPIIHNSSFCFLRDKMTIDTLNLSDTQTPVLCPSINLINPKAKGYGLLSAWQVDHFSKDEFNKINRTLSNYCSDMGLLFSTTNNMVGGRESNLQSCLHLYEKSDIVFSTTLHGCIIATAMGKKVLAFSRDWKVDAYMDAVGLSDWVVSEFDESLIRGMLVDIDKQQINWNVINQSKEQNVLMGRRIRDWLN